MIEEEIDVGILSRITARGRAEEVEVLDAEPLQFGFVRLERGDGGVSLHKIQYSINGTGPPRQTAFP